jgi:outer membrane protein assembly factor BamD
MIGVSSGHWRRIVVAAAVAATLALGACSSDDDDEYVEGSVTTLYNSAMDMMLAERYEESAKLFDEVDRQHPYSIWATKSQLMAAYAYYKNNQFDEAIISLDRFIQLHPSSRDIAYAYFLKGLAYFEQINDVKRDQASALEASRTFEELVRRFPTTRYARVAKVRIDLVRDHLAGKEMEVGRFYQSRKQHLAAINRFQKVVGQYQTTSHVAEALHRLTESYTALGLPHEAQKVAAVLGYNYPASEWYLDSYELVGDETVERPAGRKDNRSIITRAWDWLF